MSPDATINSTLGRTRARWMAVLVSGGVALAGPAGVSLVAPGVAEAGSLQIFSCARPDGLPAPTDGWSGSISGPFMGPVNSCAEGGSLAALIDGSPAQPVDAIATWAFTAPGWATIKEATLWQAASADSIAPGSAQSLSWLAAPNNIYDSADVFDQCVTDGCGSEGDPTVRFAAVNKIVVAASYLDGARSIYVNASCGGAQGASCPAVSSPYMAEAQLLAADITLEDSAPPSASAVGGSLTGSTVLQGPQNILITASDPGPGVYEAIFQVDGKTVSSSVLSSNGGRCENVGETSSAIPSFLFLQPCPAQVNSVDMPFEPGVVPEGPHDLRVLVSDAAGNTTTILDHQVIIDTTGAYTTLLARGQCNGDACDDHAQLVSSTPLYATFLRRFSRSAVTLTGRLLDHTGAAISNAQVLLLQTPEAAGESPVQVASTTTNASGDWSLAAPKGPARLLQVTYFSHLKDATPAAVLDYHERVKAAVLLRAAHRVRLGHTVVFEGRLLGGYIPSGGEPVQMEIYYRRRWRTIEVIHTNLHGQFAYRYIFTLGPGVSYAFRAVAQANAAYPFLAAASRPARVKVYR
jgi:hypothetical protein